MGKKTAAVSAEPSTVSAGAQLIRDYHFVEKQIAQLQRQLGSDASSNPKLVALQKQLADMGGLEAYQKASLKGESEGAGFDASEWVLDEIDRLKVLEQMPMRQPACPASASNQLKLLDVGAIVDHYAAPLAQKGLADTLDYTCIDLNSQHENVLQVDFFDHAKEQLAAADHPYDVVVLSLVLNFVGDIVKRGDMLRLASQLVPEGGYVFVVLPSACMTNSRYTNEQEFKTILRSVGLPVTSYSDGDECIAYSDKLFFAICQRSDDPLRRLPCAAYKRTLCRGGKERNNFCVVLTAPAGAQKEAPAQTEAPTQNQTEGDQEKKKPLTSNQRKKNRMRAQIAQRKAAQEAAKRDKANGKAGAQAEAGAQGEGEQRGKKRAAGEMGGKKKKFKKKLFKKKKDMKKKPPEETN